MSRTTPRRLLLPATAITVAIISGVGLAVLAAPQDTQVIPYQGHLEYNGTSINGSTSFAFQLFDAPPPGTPVWTGTYTTDVHRGSFSVELGSGGQPLTAAVWDAEELFITVAVEGTPLAGYQRVASIPFAASATPGITFVADLFKGVFEGLFQGRFEGPGIVPIGTILAWHPNAVNPTLRVALGDPPTGWAYCNGAPVSVEVHGPLDPDGDGLFTPPDLNGEARFLRGSATSGVLQDDQYRTHNHKTHAGGPINGTYYLSNDNSGYSGGGSHSFGYRTTVDNDLLTSIEGASETRPINMGVVWIMRID